MDTVRSKTPDICTYVDDLVHKTDGLSTSIGTAKQSMPTPCDLFSKTESAALSPDLGTRLEDTEGGRRSDATSGADNLCFSDLEGVQLRALKREANYLKQRLLCVICKENKTEVTFLPCGHLVTCSSCSDPLRTCPVCQREVLAEVKTFLS